MTTHIKALTYGPKIQAVKSGRCNQTIRPLTSRQVTVGDRLLLHTWADKPYRSKWDWQKKFMVIAVYKIRLAIGKQFWIRDGVHHPMEKFELEQIFLDDHFFGKSPIKDEPFDIERLKQELCSMSGLWLENAPYYQIIVWDDVPIFDATKTWIPDDKYQTELASPSRNFDDINLEEVRQ